MSELPSLFIANSKISLFLKKNLPLEHQKKVHMYALMKKNLNNPLFSLLVSLM
jgi:hypothetical protein